MNKYPVIPHNLSISFLDKLKRINTFDGENDAPDQCIYKDTNSNSSGLMLRLSRSGKMTFVVHGRIAKKGSSAQYFTIGNARNIYLHNARDLAKQFRTWMSEGLHPSEEHKRSTKKYTLQLIFNDYLEAKGIKTIKNRKGLREDTIKEYTKHFNKLNKKFINKDAETINHDDIIKEHNRIAKESTPFMSDKAMQLLLALFNFARPKYISADNSEIFKSNPVEIMNIENRWKAKSKRTRSCIDTTDLPALLNALEELEFYKDGVKFKHVVTPAAVVVSHFFRLMLFTGWRPEEVCKIKWEQVSNDMKHVTWNDSEAVEMLKNAEEQYMSPINSEATKVLKSMRNYHFNSEWVFPANNLTSHTLQNPSLYIDKLSEIMGSEKRFTGGIYRKTFQTYAEECGVLGSTIKRLVFHTQRHFDVQSGYIASNREHLRRQSQKVADFILHHAGRSAEAQAELVQIDSHIIANANRVASEKDIDKSEVIKKWIELGMKLDLINI